MSFYSVSTYQNHLTMAKTRNVSIFIFLCVIYSCSPKVTKVVVKSYDPIDYKQDVIVFGLDDAKPDGAEILGIIKIGDNGFTANCTLELVLETAKFEARKIGANAIKITEHKPPSAFGSSCHRISAELLKVENSTLESKPTNKNSIVDSTWNYAKLYVFRPGGYGALVSYNLFLDDDLLCRVTNNFKSEIIVRKEGLLTLWAKTESNTSIPINIEFGKEYYLKCGIQTGLLVGRPALQIISNRYGKLEYNLMK